MFCGELTPSATIRNGRESIRSPIPSSWPNPSVEFGSPLGCPRAAASEAWVSPRFSGHAVPPPPHSLLA